VLLLLLLMGADWLIAAMDNKAHELLPGCCLNPGLLKLKDLFA
jgi:hypothetical protein